MTRRTTTLLVLLGTCILGAALLVLLWPPARPQAKPSDETVPTERAATSRHPEGADRVRAAGQAPPQASNDGTVTVEVLVELEGGESIEVSVLATQAGTTELVGTLRPGTPTRIKARRGEVTWTAHEHMPQLGVSTYERLHQTSTLERDSVVKLVLRRGRTTLELHALDTEGQPVSGVVATLRGRGAEMERVTDAAGRAEWEGVEDVSTFPEPVEITRLPPTWGVRAGPVVVSKQEGRGEDRNRVVATLILARPSAGFRAVLSDYGRLVAVVAKDASGEWSREAVGGFVGWVEDAAGRRVSSAEIRSGDTYVLGYRNLAPGRYRLTYLAASSDTLRTAEFDLAANETRTIDDFSEIEIGSLQGRLEGPARSVVSKLPVSLEFERLDDVLLPTETLEVPVSPDGSFVVPVLPGARRLFFVAGGLEPGVPTVLPLVRPVTDRTDLIVESAIPGRLRGRVVDSAGSAVAGAQVWVRSRPADRERWDSRDPRSWARDMGPIVADAEGRFESEAELPGIWSVQARRTPSQSRPERWDGLAVQEVDVAPGTVTDAEVSVR